MNKIILILTLVFSVSANASVNLGDYVTDFSGKTDQTTAVQAAEAEAFRLKQPLFHPGGTILSGYVLFRVPLIGEDGYRGTKATFKSTVNDGSAAFETTSMAISNISFLGDISTSTGPKNSIGLVAGRGYYPEWVLTSTGSLSRGYLNNVQISGFATGFKGFGWINQISGLLITYCNLGALFDTYNGALIDFVGEQNKQDFILFHSNGVHFTRLLIEGTVGTTPSIIDGSSGVQIDGLYTEQHGRTAPWIKLGDVYYANAITLNGIMERCGVGCEPLQQNKVKDLKTNIYFIGGSGV
jgi:hypothetical protein